MSKLKIKLEPLHPGQQSVVDSTARFKVLCCGRRWGKSTVSQHIAVHAMLKGERVMYMAHKARFSRKLFGKYVKLFPKGLLATVNKSELIIELVNGGEITFFTGEAPDNVRGQEFDLAIIDEAAYIDNLLDAWDGDIGPTLAVSEGRAVILSTPRGKNGFFALYQKGVNRDDQFESFHFPSNNSPHFPPAEFERKRLSTPSAKFREEYLAIPSANQANPFGEEHIERNTILKLSDKPAVVIGIDVAKYHDHTVFFSLDEDGNQCHPYQRFQGPYSLIEQRIADLPADVMKIVDATGAGDPLMERLQRSCRKIQGFKISSATKPPLIEELINSVEKGQLKFNEKAAGEMQTFEFKYNSKGYISYEAQSGFHDDIVIAMALANKFRVQAQFAKRKRFY